MSDRIAIVGCGKRKRMEPSAPPLQLPHGEIHQAYRRFPLRDLYTGPLFRAPRADVERRGLRWWVLSAMHGIRAPDYLSEPYDLTIRCKTWDDSVRRAWGERAAASLAAGGWKGGNPLLPGTVVELHLGADYARWIIGPLRAYRVEIEMPVQGAIGRRLRAYRLRREAAEDSDRQLELGL